MIYKLFFAELVSMMSCGAIVYSSSYLSHKSLDIFDENKKDFPWEPMPSGSSCPTVFSSSMFKTVV